MIKADTHVHTNFSADSETSIISYIEKAISLGYHSICITDHYDINYELEYHDGTQFLFDTKVYFDTINHLKLNYKNKIKILNGVEMGILCSFKDQIETYLDTYNFDFVIGSSHFVGKMEPHLFSFWENTNKQEAILSYFESILENVKKIKNYDVYGHLDYIFRYVPDKLFDFRDYEDIISEILQEIIKDGKGIEINTGSIRYGLEFPDACKKILKIYKSLKGEIITFGSDAHNINHLGYKFNSIKNLVKGIGFKYYAVYQNRIPKFYEID